MADDKHSRARKKFQFVAATLLFTVAVITSGFLAGILTTTWVATNSPRTVDLWIFTWQWPQRKWVTDLIVVGAVGAGFKWPNEIIDAIASLLKQLRLPLAPDATVGASLYRIIVEAPKAWIVCFTIPFTIVVSSYAPPQLTTPVVAKQPDPPPIPVLRTTKAVVVFFKEELDTVMNSDRLPFSEGIKFSEDKSTAKALTLLASQLRYCNRGEHRSLVRLTGFASSSGLPHRNLDLAHRRIDIVGDVFMKHNGNAVDGEDPNKADAALLGPTSVILNRWENFQQMADARGFEDRILDDPKQRYSKNRGQLNRRVEIEIEAPGCLAERPKGAK